eukprot:g5822.t1
MKTRLMTNANAPRKRAATRGGVKDAARALLVEPRSPGNEEAWERLKAKIPDEDPVVVEEAIAEAITESRIEDENGSASRCYDEVPAKAVFKMDSSERRTIECKSGVQQGDGMGPPLFCFFILVPIVIKPNHKYGPLGVSLTAYMDDISLHFKEITATTIPVIQDLVDELQAAAIVVNRGESSALPPPRLETMLTGEKTLIGSGFIRDVYLVEWEGRKLVVKFPREAYEERVGEDFAENEQQWEAAALDAVRGHPNIVELLGICGASSVSEYYDTHLDDLVLSLGAKPLEIHSVVSLALDAARGLQALHEAPGGPIVHYDIKPEQMMLDKHGRIKINDLNTCQFADADKITEKVDVYALAMVYYCLLAGHSPYQNVKNATGMIKDGISPPTYPSWHAGFLEVGRRAE